MNVHAEGDWQVVTTGYGDLFDAEGENLYYTGTFAGTSSASPIVTGAAVSLASILWLYHGSVFDPLEMRTLLAREGTPQGTGGHIGPRPDLRKQVEHITNRHLQTASGDFDGDGRSDYAVFRPSNGYWRIRFAASGTSPAVIRWGKKGDIPAPADVDGDGRAELVVFRPSTGTWLIRYWDGTKQSIKWGAQGDLPVPLDYDGDGKAELAFYRAIKGGADGRWHIRFWNGKSKRISWGIRTDAPLARDFDQDGKDDLALFRATQGKWYILFNDGKTKSYTLGKWGDIPLAYRDSKGRWNLAVWRPGNGTFYCRNIHQNAQMSVRFGVAGDIPRFADTDGDKWDEFIIYDPAKGKWHNASSPSVVHWGSVGDLAISR